QPPAPICFDIRSAHPVFPPQMAPGVFRPAIQRRRPADSPTRLRDTSSGTPSALRGIHRQGVRNRNDILLLSVVYSISYEVNLNREIGTLSPHLAIGNIRSFKSFVCIQFLLPLACDEPSLRSGLR